MKTYQIIVLMACSVSHGVECRTNLLCRIWNACILVLLGNYLPEYDNISDLTVHIRFLFYPLLDNE